MASNQKRESPELAVKRWEQLAFAQELHPSFPDFLAHVMEAKNLSMAKVHWDIASFMDDASLGKKKCVHAQRAQSKTTIASARAVFRLIHNPSCRVLIISSTDDLASKISKGIIDILTVLPELQCMLPDTGAGDRSGINGFDVHHSLRGIDPNPSIATRPIFGSLQGYRGDLLILDDGETYANSATAKLRADLLHRIKDLASIAMDEILVLGTPQTTESVYRELPRMGFVVRYWPGRYPNPEQRKYYGDMLAPELAAALDADPLLGTGYGLDGQQGKAICPEYLGDDVLLDKEQFQGTAYFQLQHMLNASLTEEGLKPLDTNKLLVVPYAELMPVRVVPQVGGQQYATFASAGADFEFARPGQMETAHEAPKVFAYVDPALGGNVSRDRTGYAVIGALHGMLYILDIGSIRGGYDDDVMHRWATTLSKYRPQTVWVEKNAGYGTLTRIFQPILDGYAKSIGWKVGLEEDLVRTQKELRIIDTLEPVLGRRALAVTTDALASHEQSLSDLPMQDRILASVWYQLSNITRARQSLIKDDTLDALAGCVAKIQDFLAVDGKARSDSLLHKQQVMDVERRLYPWRRFREARVNTLKRNR